MTKSQQSRLHNKAEKAMREAVLKVIEEHKKTGVPLSIWKDGRVVHISAKKVRMN